MFVLCTETCGNDVSPKTTVPYCSKLMVVSHDNFCRTPLVRNFVPGHGSFYRKNFISFCIDFSCFVFFAHFMCNQTLPAQLIFLELALKASTCIMCLGVTWQVRLWHLLCFYSNNNIYSIISTSYYAEVYNSRLMPSTIIIA